MCNQYQGIFVYRLFSCAKSLVEIKKEVLSLLYFVLFLLDKEYLPEKQFFSKFVTLVFNT